MREQQEDQQGAEVIRGWTRRKSESRGKLGRSERRNKTGKRFIGESEGRKVSVSSLSLKIHLKMARDKDSGPNKVTQTQFPHLAQGWQLFLVWLFSQQDTAFCCSCTLFFHCDRQAEDPLNSLCPCTTRSLGAPLTGMFTRSALVKQASYICVEMIRSCLSEKPCGSPLPCLAPLCHYMELSKLSNRRKKKIVEAKQTEMREKRTRLRAQRDDEKERDAKRDGKENLSERKVS